MAFLHIEPTPYLYSPPVLPYPRTTAWLKLQGSFGDHLAPFPQLRAGSTRVGWKQFLSCGVLNIAKEEDSTYNYHVTELQMEMNCHFSLILHQKTHVKITTWSVGAPNWCSGMITITVKLFKWLLLHIKQPLMTIYLSLVHLMSLTSKVSL